MRCPSPTFSQPRQVVSETSSSQPQGDLEEEVSEEEAEEAQEGHHLNGHAFHRLPNCLRGLLRGRKLLSLSLDPLAKATFVLKRNDLVLSLRQLRLDLVICQLCRLGNGGRGSRNC